MTQPFTVLEVDEVDSTQDAARERMAGSDPAVVIAHRQAKGRGRSGADWETAPRSVAVSVAWTSEWEVSRLTLIPLIAGVAARRTIGEEVRLKWPNDLLVGEKKVGGILVEAREATVVAGLGLNLFWPEPRPEAVGLYPADPGPEEGPRLATAWAEELLGLVDEGAERWPKAEYEEGCVTVGREVSWEPFGRGEAVGVGEDGSLTVITESGVRRSLTSSDVRHVRPG